MADSDLRRLMKNLEESINAALADSPAIDKAIRDIKEAGYEVVLVIDATIGFKPSAGERRDSPALESGREDPVRLKITPEDAKFLKSLKISVDSDI